MADMNFLYCESTSIAIRPNDIVFVSDTPHVKWIVKRGWYRVNNKQSNGWYLKSIADGDIRPIDSDILPMISKSDNDVTQSPPFNADALSDGDVVTIDGYTGEWVVHYGKFKLGDAICTDWYVQSVTDLSIMALSDIKSTGLLINLVVSESSLSDIVPELPTTSTYTSVVLPNTDIRLYDNDIITLTTNPTVRYILRYGWYICHGVQSYGWYVVSISDGTVLAISEIDLSTINLVSTYTQGSTYDDGKKVNYTRPYTDHDVAILNRSFISLSSMSQRDNLDPSELTDGRVVRVNDIGDGSYGYFVWSAIDKSWSSITFETTIPAIVGTDKSEVILSELDPGVYLIKGQYRVSSEDPTHHISMGDTLVSISTTDNLVYIKDMSSSTISDYVVDSDGFVTISTEYVTKQYLQDIYATVEYVDTKLTVLELDIKAYVDNQMSQIPDMFDQLLSESLHEITEEYVDNLFNEED